MGTITEPNPVLVPLAGQTAIVDVGIAVQDANGNIRPTSIPPRRPPDLQRYLRPNAGTGLTDATGQLHGHRGRSTRPNTGLVTNTNPLADSPYNVGSSGKLIPLPGTVSGFYVARARVVDQSGNVVPIPTPGLNFVVDTATPAVRDHQPGEQPCLHPGLGPPDVSRSRPARTWT